MTIQNGKGLIQARHSKVLSTWDTPACTPGCLRLAVVCLSRVVPVRQHVVRALLLLLLLLLLSSCRDPRICPGCLGYALGDAPDLSNISYSVTSLDKGECYITNVT